MGSKNESSFTRACKTQAGRNGLILCFGSVAALIVMMTIAKIIQWQMPFIVMVLPGILSMFGMQNFANEANRIRMEMEQEERDPHKR